MSMKRNEAGRAPLDPRRALGVRGEEDARAFLEDLGLAVIARNERTARGELDLIASDGNVLVFVEVKARHAWGGTKHLEGTLGWPSARQRMRQRGAARLWLADPERVRPRTPEVRFDVVRVLFDEHERLIDIQHLEGI